MTAPAGNLINEYCVKAGSDQSVPDGAVVNILVDPPQASITVPHPSGKSVSHYSFAWEPIVEETTTTTTTTTTTVPEEETTTTTAATTTSEQQQQPATTTTTTEALIAVNAPPPAAATPVAQTLPSTGSSSWSIVFVGLAALGAGLGLARIARRDEDAELQL